MYSIDGVFKA